MAVDYVFGTVLAKNKIFSLIAFDMRLKQEMTRQTNIAAGYTKMKETNAYVRFKEILTYLLKNVDFKTVPPD